MEERGASPRGKKINLFHQQPRVRRYGTHPLFWRRLSPGPRGAAALQTWEIMAHKPIVAVVGRPNVGESTLFNRLVKARKAIVDDQPGVTRDRHYAEVQWGHREFMLMDTGGFVPEGKDLFNTAIREQVEVGLQEADLVLLVGDAKTGVTQTDQVLAKLIRDAGKPALLVVNKADNERLELEAAEFWKLGLDEPVPVSAISGRLSGDLLDHIVARLPEGGGVGLEGDLRVAIIGRPNVGKSSLVNRLLGQERVMVTPVAGTTRDSIDSLLTYQGRRYVLVDTAGLRRRTRIKENVEFYAGLRSQAAIQSADVCVLLVDAEEGLTHQDVQVLEEAITARKGVLIGVNKWDLVPDKVTNTARDRERLIREQIPTLDWVEVMFLSALTGQRARRVLDLSWDIHQRHHVRLRRADLEAALLPEIRKRPPAAHGGRWVRIEAVRQVRDNPPWIVFQCNHPEELDTHYVRFLEKRLRGAFDLRGVPVRLDFRRRRDFLEAFGPIPPEDEVMNTDARFADARGRGWEEEDDGFADEPGRSRGRDFDPDEDEELGPDGEPLIWDPDADDPFDPDKEEVDPDEEELDDDWDEDDEDAEER
jgi:GTP-binding protein